ncbi:hypothetical protein RUM8411_01080 [Ruegeria meonggei]|uniref:Uncharacterized protein n=1 Tax=Ruegeria meonggei TaxID=1446476 RepID=A0A1X6YP50_9RHOB|nr:hypothetical protein RUM8411_01080 [Ruegeria meonggei]
MGGKSPVLNAPAQNEHGPVVVDRAGCPKQDYHFSSIPEARPKLPIGNLAIVPLNLNKTPSLTCRSALPVTVTSLWHPLVPSAPPRLGLFIVTDPKDSNNLKLDGMVNFKGIRMVFPQHSFEVILPNVERRPHPK